MRCGKCHEDFGPGKFCVSCGSSKEESELAMKISSGIRDKKGERTAWLERNKRALRIVISVLSAGAIYGAVQLGLYLGIGPEVVLEKYASAIESGEQSVLADAEIFANPKQTSSVHTFLSDFRDEEATQAVALGVVNRTGYTASAELTSKLGRLSLDLTATPKWFFGFQVPEWKITTNPSRVTVNVSPVLANQQELSVKSGGVVKTVEQARSAIPGSTEVFLLPGKYVSVISGLGLLPETTVELKIWGSTSGDFILQPGEIELKSKAQSGASQLASKFARSCVYNKCKSMRKFSENDFNLWAQFADTGYRYTSSRFNVGYDLDKCTLSSISAKNPKEAEANFECRYEARGHLYVRYTYYSGWYSDYYYYWNFYDTRDGYFPVTIPVFSNIDGSIQTLGDAS